MIANNMSNSDELPKKRGKYKDYCDASFPFKDVPRQTKWNILNPQSAVNLVERRHEQQYKKNDECDSLNIETLARQDASHPDRLPAGPSVYDPGQENQADCQSQYDRSFQAEITRRAACSHSHLNARAYAADQDDPNPNSSPDGSSDDEESGGENEDFNSQHLNNTSQSEKSNQDDSDPNTSRDGCESPIIETLARQDASHPDRLPAGSSDYDPGQENQAVCRSQYDRSFQAESTRRTACSHSHLNARAYAAGQDDPNPNSSPDGSSDDEESGGENEDFNSQHLNNTSQSEKSNQDDSDPNTSPDGSCDENTDRQLPTHHFRTQVANQQNNAYLNPSLDEESDEGFPDNPYDDGQHDMEEFSDDLDSEDNGDEETPNFPQQDNQPRQHPQQQPPPGQNNLRDKLQGEYSERIQDQVAASRGEVMLNIQEFCKQHPLPLTAQEDLYKLINTMFYKEILPETTYKLDKLYSSSVKIRYYFYCSKCFKGFGELNYKVVRVHECDICKIENTVHDLTRANFFIIIEFVEQFQLLLQDPEIAAALKNPNEFPDNGDIMKDLHDGSVYKKFAASLDFSNGQNYISLCANADGTPVFDSSNLSIWPIFISVNELPPHIRMANVLLAGLWFGRSHPQMDLFLEPFSNYVERLSVEGFSLKIAGEVKHYKAFLLGMCVDSGARGAMQCVHSHTGESSCNWCLHPGEVEGGGSNARKFLQFDLEAAKRTAEQVLRDGMAVLKLLGKDNHINGVTGLTPLLRCPKFDVVEGFVLDGLHWASFGLARRTGKLWLGETKKKKKKKDTKNLADDNTPKPDYYVGTDETQSVINSRISGLRPPREVRRRPRDLSQIHDYNAREWENWALYFSVPLFKNILPERFLKHWTLFVQAFYLLMKSTTTKTEIKVAGILMKKYVDGVLDLYGRQELTFNMHISNHAADNALRWGNGWSVSTYAFENGNKILKSKIHAERGIPHQLIRSLNRDSALSVLRDEASTAQTDAFKKNMERKEVKNSFFAGSVRCIMMKNFNPSREELWYCQQEGIDAENFMQCTRIIHNKVCYAADKGSCKTDNSFVRCVDGTIVKIRNIIADEMSGRVYLFVSKVRCRPYALGALPRSVTSVNFSPFLYTVDLVEEGATIISCEELETICVHSKVDCRFYKGNFLSVMANTSNIF